MSGRKAGGGEAAGAAADKEVDVDARSLRRLRQAWGNWALAGLIALSVPSLILWAEVGVGLASLASSKSRLACRRPGLHLLETSRQPRPGGFHPARPAGCGQPSDDPARNPDLPASRLPVPAATLRPAGLASGADLYGGAGDGLPRRLLSHAETLGSRGLGLALDIEFDGLATFCGTAVAVHYGRLPVIYLATVGTARYLFLLAGWTTRQARPPGASAAAPATPDVPWPERRWNWARRRCGRSPLRR